MADIVGHLTKEAVEKGNHTRLLSEPVRKVCALKVIQMYSSMLRTTA